jgi:hypothetical protein
MWFLGESWPTGSAPLVRAASLTRSSRNVAERSGFIPAMATMSTRRANNGVGAREVHHGR